MLPLSSFVVLLFVVLVSPLYVTSTSLFTAKLFPGTNMIQSGGLLHPRGGYQFTAHQFVISAQPADMKIPYTTSMTFMLRSYGEGDGTHGYGGTMITVGDGKGKQGYHISVDATGYVIIAVIIDGKLSIQTKTKIMIPLETETTLSITLGTYQLELNNGNITQTWNYQAETPIAYTVAAGNVMLGDLGHVGLSGFISKFVIMDETGETPSLPPTEPDWTTPSTEQVDPSSTPAPPTLDPIPVASLLSHDDLNPHSRVHSRFNPGTSSDSDEDPQLVGFQNQQFQIPVRGFPGAWFNLIQSPTLSLNAKFKHITTKTCYQNQSDTNQTICTTQTGTSMSAFGITILESVSNRTLRLSVVADSASSGLHLLINGSPINHDSFTLNSLSIKHHSSSKLSIHTSLFVLHIANHDNFLTLDVELHQSIIQAGKQFTDLSQSTQQLDTIYPKLDIHGLLGATWCNIIYSTGRQYDGNIDEYICSGQFDHDSVL